MSRNEGSGTPPPFTVSPDWYVGTDGTCGDQTLMGGPSDPAIAEESADSRLHGYLFLL